ncbi:MAG: 1-deoxy-D-xylulose-5-phosphate reductoisomerase, partial [Planifilum fulgidum]
MKQRIAVLGSTGSIGKNTLAVVREHPDQFEVVGLAAGSNVQEMVRQIREFSPRIVSMASPGAAGQVRREAGPGVGVVV